MSAPALSPLAGVPLAGIEAVIAARREQIERYGHTPESDAARPLREFGRDIQSRGTGISETIQFNQPKAVLRKRAIKLAALLLALIDRIDSEEASNES